MSLISSIPAAPSIEVVLRRSDRTFGAEVVCPDLRTITAADFAALHQAWIDYQVLLFRGQSFQQEDLIRVTAYFGEIAPLARPPKYFPKGYSRLLPNIMMISNIRENGETIGALPDGEMHFHTDQCHRGDGCKPGERDRQFMRDRGADADEGAQHQQLSLREIDDLYRVEDQQQPERDQRIDAAERKPIHDELAHLAQ